MLEFDETALKNGLTALSYRKQLAFMLFLCERMAPGLQQFANDTGYDLSPYRECLEKGWAYLEGRPDPDGYERLAQNCVDNAPDTEDFDHVLRSAALDAALSISDLMTFLCDRNIGHIVEAAGWARDTVALYVDGVESDTPVSLPLDRVMKHPLVQQELKRQKQDLAFLASLPDDQGTVQLLREHSKRPPGLLGDLTAR